MILRVVSNVVAAHLSVSYVLRMDVLPSSLRSTTAFVLYNMTCARDAGAAKVTNRLLYGILLIVDVSCSLMSYV